MEAFDTIEGKVCDKGNAVYRPRVQLHYSNAMVVSRRESQIGNIVMSFFKIFLSSCCFYGVKMLWEDNGLG